MKTRTNVFSASPNYLYSNYFAFFVFLSLQLLLVLPLLGQVNLPCYSISKQTNQGDQLHEYNSNNQVWKNLGNTGTFDIESIAVDYENSVIYAVDNGVFGTINPITAKFTEINELGYCNGALGSILIDDVCAITYDEINQVVYSVHRNGNNSILFKINPKTGEMVDEAFLDNNGMTVDYALVEGVLFGSPQTNYITDVTDIAFNIDNQILYAMYQNDNVRIISNINSIDGSVESKTNIIYREFGGIGFDSTGKLQATTLSNESLNDFSSLFTIDIFESSTDLVGVISRDFEVDFICIDCAKKMQQISNCDIEINLTDYSPQMNTVIASQTINSNANITTQTANYIAVDFINLSSYFEVSTNTNFAALIENACE